MTVKVNPDHLQNEISLRLGRDLPSIKISCKSICNFLRHDKANQTDRLMSALAEIIKCREDCMEIRKVAVNAVNRKTEGE